MATLRPFQIGVIAFFAIAALAGLYVFTTVGGVGGSKTQIGTVVIWGTLPKAAVDAGLATLTQGHDEYAGLSYIQVPESSFAAKLADALASGTGPDAVILTQEDLLTEASKLRPIPFNSFPKRNYLDTYLPEFELYITDDGVYGVPLVLDPLMLYWNRAILSSAGVAAAPNSWEAVGGLANAITKRTDAGVVTRSLIPLGGYANIDNARATLSLLLLQAGTPITARSDNTNTIAAVFGNDQKTQTGLTPAQSAVNFYAQFADPAKTIYSWNSSLPEARQAFIAGDVALYPGFASERTGIADANPNLDFDMAPVPVPGTLANRLTYGQAYAMAITKAGKNPAGAYSAALALSSVGKDIAEASGMAPARRGDLTPSANDKYQAVFYPEALAAKGWLSPSPSTVDTVFSAMIDNVISGRKSPGDSVTFASQAMTAALR